MPAAIKRLLLADDQSLFLSGIEALLTMTGEYEVVGTAHSGETAFRLAREGDADVLLLDIGMPDRSGIEIVRQLRGAGVRVPVLIVSNHDDRRYVVQAIAAGVQGYVLKDATAETLRAAVQAVAEGRRYVDPRLVGHMMDALAEAAGQGAHTTCGAGFSGPPESAGERAGSAGVLTPRELEVLRLMARGYNNAEIARTLYISPKTARNHTTSILQKLGVQDRTKAVVLALSESAARGMIG